MAAKTTTIRSLAVAFTARTKNFTKGIKRMQRRLGGFAKSIGRVVKRIAFIGAAIVGALGAATAAIFVMANRVTQMGDKIAKASKATGIMVEDLSGLGFAAERSGSSLDAIIKSVGVFARNAGQAADGLETYRREFRRLGVDVKDGNGELKDTKDIFLETGFAIGKLQNATQRIASAKALFGRGGVELIPLFREGEEGLERLINRAKELGAVWTTEQARISENFQDTLTDMKEAWGGLIRQVTFVVVPKIITAMSRLTAFIQQNRDKIVKLWTKATDLISRGVAKVLSTVDELAQSGFLDNLFNKMVIGFRFVFFDLPILAKRAFDVVFEGVQLLGRRIVLELKTAFAEFQVFFLDKLQASSPLLKRLLGVTGGQLNVALFDAHALVRELNNIDIDTSKFDKATNSLIDAKDNLLDFVDKQMSKTFIENFVDSIKFAVAEARKVLSGFTADPLIGDDTDTPTPTPKDFRITERPAALERGSVGAFSAGVARPLFRSIEKPISGIFKNSKTNVTQTTQTNNLLQQLVNNQTVTIGD